MTDKEVSWEKFTGLKKNNDLVHEEFRNEIDSLKKASGNGYRYDALDKQLEGLSQDVKEIKENHIVHLAKDISELKIDSTENKINQEWLMWWTRALIILMTITSVGVIAGFIIQLVKR